MPLQYPCLGGAYRLGRRVVVGGGPLVSGADLWRLGDRGQSGLGGYGGVRRRDVVRRGFALGVLAGAASSRYAAPRRSLSRVRSRWVSGKGVHSTSGNARCPRWYRSEWPGSVKSQCRQAVAGRASRGWPAMMAPIRTFERVTTLVIKQHRYQSSVIIGLGILHRLSHSRRLHLHDSVPGQALVVSIGSENAITSATNAASSTRVGSSHAKPV